MSNEPLTTRQIFLETWKATRGGMPTVLAYQQKHFQDIVAYAREHSRFYAERYRDLPDTIQDVRSLPIVSKPELMEHFEDWITDPAIQMEDLQRFIADPEKIGQFFLDKYTVCTTSGTTGTPAVLLQDQATMNLMGALNVLRAARSWMTMKDLARIMRMGMHTAAVWAAGGHFLGITMMKRQILEKPSRARAMRIFSVLDPLAKTVEGLNEFQPAMLNGYATAISLLAGEQAAGRLNIHPVLVMTSSESLALEERARISQTFGCLVRDNYGCSEFVAMAYGCAHGWLHVHADWVILEPVDEEMQPVRPGETSRSVLLTNLSNRVQPVLRYNLGDRITVNPEPCPCGSPLPAIRVEGRTDEILRLTARNGQVVPVLPLALWSVLKQVPGVHRFQVIQTGPAALKIRLEADPAQEKQDAWVRICQEVNRYFASQGLDAIALSLAEEPPMRDPKSGKYRHVWSEAPAGRAG